jgi:hypothetical protein
MRPSVDPDTHDALPRPRRLDEMRALGMADLAAKLRARSLTEHTSRLKRFPSLSRRTKMRAFLRRFLMHYGIYRRYPLGLLPALRNAWRTARA